MMLISCMVLLQQYFNRRRALAVSIASVGFSVGGLISGPVTLALLEAYTVRGTLLIIAGIYFQLSVFCCLFRPAPVDCREVTSGKTKSADSAHGTEEMVVIVGNGKSDASSKLQQNCELTVDTENDRRLRSRAARLLHWLGKLFADLFDFSLLRRIPFQLFVISSFCLFAGLTSFLQHTPSRAAHFGVESWLIAVMPIVTCSASGIARLVFGFIANLSCTSLVLQYAISLTLTGMVQSITWLATTFETMVLYCVIQGTINGQ